MGGRVIVVGAGVIGLSCAVRLAEAGFDTHVLARELPLETSSAVAGALWAPWRVPTTAWATDRARRTHEELTRCAEDPTTTGVRLQEGIVLDDTAAGPAPRPAWAATGATAASPVDRPAPGHAGGWLTTVPLVAMDAYLPWLVTRLEAAGGTLTRLPLAALPPRGVVVNATGVAARSLAGDDAVRPVRGQVAVLENPGLTRWLVSADGALSIVPRGADVVVGETSEPDDWGTVPDPEQATGLLQRAAAAEPRLAGTRLRGHRVGLRAARPQVRVETVHRPQGGAVVHCYGHGGAGVTLSWGSADDVLEQVRALP